MSYSPFQFNWSENTSETTSPLSCTYSIDCQEGDLLYVGAGTWGGSVTVNVYDTLNNDWNQVGGSSGYAIGDGGDQITSGWWCVCKASGPNTVHLAPSASVYQGLAIGEWSGVSSSLLDGYHLVPTNTGSGTSVSSGTIPVSGTKRLLVMLVGQSEQVSSLSSTFNVRTNPNSDAGDAVYMVDDLSVSASMALTGTFTKSFNWSGLGASFYGSAVSVGQVWPYLDFELCGGMNDLGMGV